MHGEQLFSFVDDEVPVANNGISGGSAITMNDESICLCQGSRKCRTSRPVGAEQISASRIMHLILLSSSGSMVGLLFFSD
jgi:hypothetical protein